MKIKSQAVTFSFNVRFKIHSEMFTIVYTTTTDEWQIFKSGYVLCHTEKNQRLYQFKNETTAKRILREYLKTLQDQ